MWMAPGIGPGNGSGFFFFTEIQMLLEAPKVVTVQSRQRVLPAGKIPADFTEEVISGLQRRS